MKAPTSIVYELRDPLTGRPRYVGVTFDRWNNPGDRIKERLTAHCSSAAGSIAKAEWLLNLRKHGLRPTIHPLETVPTEQAGQVERRWIIYLRNRGEDLTNVHPKIRPVKRCPHCGGSLG